MRAIFYVSDGTGITAETIGQGVLTQFDGVEVRSQKIPFVKDAAQASSAVARIQSAWQATGLRPIVVTTVMDPDLTQIIAASGALILDAFAPFIAPLEEELQTKRQARVGQAHGMANRAQYDARIDATNYSLAHDDGVDPEYMDADVVLIGVSRSGKTPTCLYLALNHGVRAANCPLTDEELGQGKLPDRLRRAKERMFGLTIDPLRLQQIREVRRPASKYASLAQCRWEVNEAEIIFRRERIDVLDTTSMSVEEISTRILDAVGRRRGGF